MENDDLDHPDGVHRSSAKLFGNGGRKESSCLSRPATDDNKLESVKEDSLHLPDKLRRVLSDLEKVELLSPMSRSLGERQEEEMQLRLAKSTQRQQGALLWK